MVSCTENQHVGHCRAFITVYEVNGWEPQDVIQRIRGPSCAMAGAQWDGGSVNSYGVSWFYNRLTHVQSTQPQTNGVEISERQGGERGSSIAVGGQGYINQVNGSETKAQIAVVPAPRIHHAIHTSDMCRLLSSTTVRGKLRGVPLDIRDTSTRDGVFTRLLFSRAGTCL